jgi:DNA-3-methyladenine glycosylase
MNKLPRSFYARNTLEVAQDLLGKFLVFHDNDIRRIGRIVEVEGYTGTHDLACHASKGRTKRTEVMFGHAGYAYVYMIYGLYNCINVVTEEVGQGCAVLIRALEPIENLERANGPGLLCKAMGIDRRFSGHDLESENLFIASDPACPDFEVVARPRIGVDYAGEWKDKLYRFYIKSSPYISKK